ncbi:hypothetical protein Ae201684P_015419 [Aphanomyces euteiches]|nr:hypothetical protein Ae201684P_015419 [Aphanomyces euteiches]
MSKYAHIIAIADKSIGGQANPVSDPRPDPTPSVSAARAPAKYGSAQKGKGRAQAVWCDSSVELLLRLRFADMSDRFNGARNSQMKKEAYGMLADELSTAMGREYDHNQLHQLRKSWFHPKHKPTGNGKNVKSKPQYFDIMFEYWGSKPGYSRDSLLSSDTNAAIQTIDDNDQDSERSSENFLTSSDTEHNPGNSDENEAISNMKKRSKPEHFSRPRANEAIKKPKTSGSQADSILRGLEAVGTGLQSLGTALTAAPVGTGDNVAQEIKLLCNAKPMLLRNS